MDTPPGSTHDLAPKTPAQAVVPRPWGASDGSLSRLSSGMNDAQAARQFLAAYESSSAHTLRAYLKEIRRFLLWLNYQQPPSPRALPYVTRQTVADYIEFLSRGGMLPRDVLASSGWTAFKPPFTGKKLSPSSLAMALTVLSSFFDALTQMDDGTGQPYCRFNPLRLKAGAFGVRALQRQFSPAERGLDLAAWQWVLRAIDRPKDLYERQQRWTILLLYYTFLRRHEATRLRMGDFFEQRGVWHLRVQNGKGGRPRQIVAPEALMVELGTWRMAQGLSPRPSPYEDRPALGFGRSGGPLSDAKVYTLCRLVFSRAADLAQAAGDTASEQTLRRASPHWLRHTGISHAMEAGVDPRYVQAQAGHSSLTITSLYDHKDQDAWAQAFNRWAQPLA